ncbi:ribonuclease H-like domain-containing protein, partial [Tanacetum coccineum]
FGCPVTILNTIDHLGKFDGKADEGFFVGYSLNCKAFRVFNSRTRIVEENLHIRFSENTPNVVSSGPDFLFDIDTLTKSMNYKPVIAGNQSNGNAGTQACENVGKAKMETVPGKDYILLPLWTTDPPFSQDLKSSHDHESKPSNDDQKKVDEEPRKDSECKDQEKKENVNSTNNDNTVSSIMPNSTNNVNVASTNEVNVVGGKISIELPNDPNMYELENIVYLDDDEDVDADADMNNLDAFMIVSPILTTRVHKDHLVKQIIRDLNSSPQTRRMTENLEEYGFVGFEDPDFPNKVYKVEKALYGLHPAPKALYETLSTYLLDNGFQRGKIDKTLFIKRHNDDILLVQVDYAGASLDRKSTTGGCQFFGSRLISWQCKKQTVVANSITEVEYVAASSCCGQVLWIQN